MEKNTCRWNFGFIERGHITYKTECGGHQSHYHIGYVYCPFCGKYILIERGSDKKVKRHWKDKI